MVDTAGENDEDMQLALQMSLLEEKNGADMLVLDNFSGETPEPKRTKPTQRQKSYIGKLDSVSEDGILETTSSSEIMKTERGLESPLEREKREQRDLRAKAAEKRLQMQHHYEGISIAARVPLQHQATEPQIQSKLVSGREEESVRSLNASAFQTASASKYEEPVASAKDFWIFLTKEKAASLYSVVFGSEVPSQILSQWSRQGFRFSNHPETFWGLVQREGGPCGVLAPIQALLIKHLIFSSDNATRKLETSKQQRKAGSTAATLDVLSCTEDQRNRALIEAMAESLWLAGGGKNCVLAIIDSLEKVAGNAPALDEADPVVNLDSSTKLQTLLKVKTCNSRSMLHSELEGCLPIFQGGLGALLLLFSALLSRTLEGVEEDRDDPGLPLVTSPFGHASQEIVNLLLCGHAVPNVFDGNMDLGGGMCLKGIPSDVEVGFLTLLEALNLCKVGEHLKNPRWPVWVVGSENHYTILFSQDKSVLVDSESDSRESVIKKAFDDLDASGGGGYLTRENLTKLLAECLIVPTDEVQRDLFRSDFIVWNEFLDILRKLDQARGGLQNLTSVAKTKQFELFHFNGIAKLDVGGTYSGPQGGSSSPRPRFTKLVVQQPPKWMPETSFAEIGFNSSDNVTDQHDSTAATSSAQHAQLVDCVRTRWTRSTCRWTGDPPSIV